MWIFTEPAFYVMLAVSFYGFWRGRRAKMKKLEEKEKNDRRIRIKILEREDKWISARLDAALKNDTDLFKPRI